MALVGTLAYVLCFACGAGPVPGILVSEINPGAIRGAGDIHGGRPQSPDAGVAATRAASADPTD